MKIELENLFLQSCKEGVNLFLGAGFSLDAKDLNDKTLPLGQELANELSSKFAVPSTIPLQNIATILEAKNKKAFYDFLIHRMTVNKFSENYFSLEKLNLKSVFTTNIDDLVYKIFATSAKYYINDNSTHGPTFNDLSAIEYYPLHGSIVNKKNGFIFSSLAIASTFSNSPKLWSDLMKAIEKFPTIFWGYSLSDSGILQTLNAVKQNNSNDKQKWIVLHDENEDEELYFKSLGFNIVVSSNQELLKYFTDNLSIDESTENWDFNKKTKTFFPKESVPKNPVGLPVRSINEFYLGASPTWTDIFSGAIFKTSHYQKIQDSIFSQKNTIVLGAPATGKTTLMMQVAAFINFNGHKLILEYPSIEKANNIIRKLNNEPALVFVDNFCDDIDGFLELNKQENIKLVGVDREHNFEIVSHFVDRRNYNLIQVTSLTDSDIQEIYSRIPETLKNSILRKKIIAGDEQPSLFEIINLNIKLPSISERFKEVLEELENQDELLTDFLLLASYVHQCRTPLSFDMTYSFFQEDIKSYQEVYELRDQLGSLITDYAGNLIDTNDQDYFAPRSVIVAEAIIDQAKSEYLKRMLYRFKDALPRYRIVNYNIFRKRAHDKMLMVKAFPDWEEGKYYYEELMNEDPHNPYLLQQGALYLSYKSKFTEAFYWIDKARNLAGDKVLSIRNSYAIILFEANIRKEDSSVRPSLDDSMQILKQCCLEDKRKLYHVKKFSEQSLDYYKKYGDETALSYISQASIWLTEELRVNDWHRGLKELKRKVDLIKNYMQ